jgi:hypothetical protein
MRSKIDVNVLKDMYEKGFTYSEMAIHFSTSKGAIAGKCYRLKLKGRRELGINLNQNYRKEKVVKDTKSIKSVTRPPPQLSIELAPSATNRQTFYTKDIMKNMSKADLLRMLRQAVENT